jgi:hypothetical protein
VLADRSRAAATTAAAAAWTTTFLSDPRSARSARWAVS